MIRMYMAASLLLVGSLRAEEIEVTVEVGTYQIDARSLVPPEKIALDSPEGREAALEMLRKRGRVTESYRTQGLVTLDNAFDLLAVQGRISVQVPGKIVRQENRKYHVELVPRWQPFGEQRTEFQKSLKVDGETALGERCRHITFRREFVDGDNRQYEYLVATVTLQRPPVQEVQLRVELFELVSPADGEPLAIDFNVLTPASLEELRKHARRRYESVEGIVELDKNYQLQTTQGLRGLSVGGNVVKRPAGRYRLEARTQWHGPDRGNRWSDSAVELTPGESVSLGGVRSDRQYKGKREVTLTVTVVRLEEVK